MTDGYIVGVIGYASVESLQLYPYPYHYPTEFIEPWYIKFDNSTLKKKTTKDTGAVSEEHSSIT